MTTTTFIDGTTRIVASWLNDVNARTYSNTFNDAQFFNNGVTIGTVGGTAAAAFVVDTDAAIGFTGGDWLAWFRHQGIAASNECLIRQQHFSAGYATLPIYTFIAARGTAAVPVTLSSGDILGTVAGRGYDGSAVDHGEYAVGFSDTSAQMAFITTETWSGTAHGSKIVFSATPAGSISPVTVATLTPASGANSVTIANSATNPTIGTSAGNLAITPTLALSAAVAISHVRSGPSYMTLEDSATAGRGGRIDWSSGGNGIYIDSLASAGWVYIGSNSGGGNATNVAISPSNAEQVRVVGTASANRYLTLTGSNGGNPTIGTSAGMLAISGASSNTAADAATLALRGGQIGFPATQVASTDVNTLDDYEEGTWTPTISFATNGDLSVGYTTQVGSYTKIGNTVRLCFDIVTSSFTHTTAASNLQLKDGTSALPFLGANVTGLRHFGTLIFSGITKATYTQFSPYVEVNDGTIRFTASGSAVAVSNVVAADMPTAGTVWLRGVIVYQTAT